MGISERIETRIVEARAIARLLPMVPCLLPGAAWSAARLLRHNARQHPDVLAIATHERRLSWAEADRAVDRMARAFREMGVGQGDHVAILMDGRAEYMIAVTALNRLRAVGALLNTNVTGTALAHALRVAEAKRVVVGSEHVERLDAVLPLDTGLDKSDVYVQRDPEGEAPTQAFESLDALVAAQDATPFEPFGAPTNRDPMCFIYTSGTTGLPKAAIITNSRFMGAGSLFSKIILDMSPGDVNYVTTPTYHSVAMFGGWGGALTSGGAMALRRKFSASRFWEDIRYFDADYFVYIGELCRYLLNRPVGAHERDHHIRIASGNGLRPDIWQEFQERFDIPLIREYYGATEGAGGSVNLVGKPGKVGRLQTGSAIVRCDLETGDPILDENGFCTRVDEDEVGLLVSRISAVSPYDGYADEAASKKKVLTGVFAAGDRYFNSGDLLHLGEDGWLSFADRVGDTFRWKGENVSTNEVAEILNGAPGVLETNVYGVQIPNTDGRAGMASVNVDEEFDIETFAGFVGTHLPNYQRPYFVRVQHDMRITGTFKHQKVEYRREGYDPAKVSDPLYFLDGEQYVALDAPLFDAIQTGERTLR